MNQTDPPAAEAEPICKFEQGCHRVVACDPGCGAAPAVFPEPPSRAAVLLEAAEHLLTRCPHLGKPGALRTCTCAAAEELLRLASQEPGAPDYASAREALLRRLAAETQQQKPERCTRCTHPKSDHDGRADHREKFSPLVAGEPWCHACNAECDYTGAQQQPATEARQPRPSRPSHTTWS